MNDPCLPFQGSPENRSELRLATLDLSRASEQTAIVLSLLQGRGVDVRVKGRRRQPLEATPGNALTYGLRSIIGYLKAHNTSGRVIACDSDHTIRSVSRAPALDKSPYTFLPNTGGGLRFVLLPVNGGRDLVCGHDGGSITAIVGAQSSDSEPFELFPECGSSEQHSTIGYLAVIQPAERLNPAGIRIDDDALATASLPLTDLFVKDIISLPKFHPPTTPIRPITIGVMSSDFRKASQDYRNIVRGLIGKEVRTHAFFGSPIAASLAVLIPRWGLDGFIGVVSNEEAIALAVATICLKGSFHAIPLQTSTPPLKKKAKPSEPFVTVGTKVLEPKSFSRSESAFLLISGITENLALRGVRFSRRGTVATHTLLLRANTKTVRSILTHHDLASKEFRLLIEEGKSLRLETRTYPQIFAGHFSAS